MYYSVINELIYNMLFCINGKIQRNLIFLRVYKIN